MGSDGAEVEGDAGDGEDEEEYDQEVAGNGRKDTDNGGGVRGREGGYRRPWNGNI